MVNLISHIYKLEVWYELPVVRFEEYSHINSCFTNIFKFATSESEWTNYTYELVICIK